MYLVLRKSDCVIVYTTKPLSDASEESCFCLLSLENWACGLVLVQISQSGLWLLFRTVGNVFPVAFVSLLLNGWIMALPVLLFPVAEARLQGGDTGKLSQAKRRKLMLNIKPISSKSGIRC